MAVDGWAAQPTEGNSNMATSPSDFFTKELPEQMAGAAEGIDEGPGQICFEVTGEGLWSLGITGGEIEVTEGRHEDTLVQVTLDGSDWEAAVKRLQEGGGMGPLSAAGGGGGMAAMLKNPQAASTLKAAQGTLKVVTTDGDKQDWVAVTFGGAEPNVETPRATLSMSREIAEQMAKGEANPQELFMSGKIQITGDMMMLMQLAPVLS